MSDLSVIKKLKVAELKAALGARGLAVKGKKDDLVKRLMEAMEADEAPTADSTAEENEAEEAVEEEQSDAVSQESVEEPPNKGESTPAETTTEENEINDTPEDSEGKQDGQPAADWVIVEPPTTEESAAVQEASEPQNEAIHESNEQPAEEQPVQEATIDTPPVQADSNEDIEMKETEDTTTASATEQTTVKTTAESASNDTAALAEPMEASAETPAVDEVKSTTEEKPKEKEGEGKKDAETEVKKAEKVPDVMIEVEDEEGEEFVLSEIPEGHVGLDQYTSDMHFIVSNNGLSGGSLVKNGFAYCWAGARANKGAKGGKVGYEVKIIKFQEVELPEDESPVHAIRIGWSAETANLQLGEAGLSYGFESTGKVCASSSFFDYGTTFAEGDVIGTYLDLESEPKTLKYTKNGEDLGVAMSLTVNLEEKPLFPHLLLRNVTVDLNFGGNESPWFDVLEGYTLIQVAPEENTTVKTTARIPEEEQCEVLLMIGLPSAGKSVWVRKYCDSHPEKQYNVISMQQLLERSKLEGKKRRKNDKGHDDLMKGLMKALTKLFQLCPKRRRNFIYDQNNVYKVAQEKKMELFSEFKRKAVLIVPTHDNLRRRTSDAKRKGDNIHDVPFGDLCDMKCEFTIPEVGEHFEEVIFPELDEKNSSKTVRDYHSDGARAKRTGRDEYYPKKRPRYDDRRRDNRYGGGGGRDRRDDSGWRSSGSGYGGYESGYNKGGRSDYKGRSHSGGNYQDPYRRHSGGSGGGGNYRQSSYGSSGSGGGYRSGGYGSAGGGYGQSYGSGGYGQSNYSSSYGTQNYGANYGSNYNYGNYNQAAGNRSTTGQWAQQTPQQQYGAYNTNQTTPSTQQAQWGTGGQWSTGYNYTGSNTYGSGGGSGYSY